jgi:hypothetical protein
MPSGCLEKAIWLFSMDFTGTKTKFSLSPAGKKVGPRSWQMRKAV